MEKNFHYADVAGKFDKRVFLLASDLHTDDMQFDKKRFEFDFDEAKEREARVYINGDIISIITKSDLKRYVASSNRFANLDAAMDWIIENAYETLLPYVDIIDLIGCGNHEVSALKYHETDPTRRIIKMLNQKRDKKLPEIAHGGYTGIIRIQLKFHKGNGKQSFDIFYNHGQGGSAPITKGAIDLNRRQYAVVDMILLGHKHQRMMQELDALLSLNGNNNIAIKDRWGLLTGCYLKRVKEYDIKKTGYQMDYGEEKMRTLQAVGGIFLSLRLQKEPCRIISTVEMTH